VNILRDLPTVVVILGEKHLYRVVKEYKQYFTTPGRIRELNSASRVNQSD
jgi:hypothetical protein